MNIAVAEANSLFESGEEVSVFRGAQPLVRTAPAKGITNHKINEPTRALPMPTNHENRL